MKIDIPVLEEFSFIHGVITTDCDLLNKWKKEILIETYPLQTTGIGEHFSGFSTESQVAMSGMRRIAYSTS